MPVYEYECAECRSRVELLLRTADEQPRCPECGSTGLKKLFSVFGVGGSEPESPPPCGGSCTCR